MTELQINLAILYFCTFVYSLKYNSICHYTYDYQCALKTVHYNRAYSNQKNQCTTEHIPSEVNFNIMLDERNSSKQGIIRVNFKSPNEQCIYKVVLFVNTYIKDSVNCKIYKFEKNNYAEIHTTEKTICPKFENKTIKNNNRIRQIETFACNENNLSLWYEHVYTGCYALGFKTDDDYVIVGNTFLKTEYKKIDLMEPNLFCTYKSILNNHESSFEILAITVDISFRAGSSGLQLEVSPISSLLKNEMNVCNRHSKHPVIVLLLGLSRGNDTDITSNNCTLTTMLLSTGDVAKTLECNFIIQNSPKGVAYCFLVRLVDDRCHKNTFSKPLFGNKIPCAWIQYCMKIKQNRTEHIEELNTANTNGIIKIPEIFYVILFIAIILIVLSIVNTIYTAYRKHAQNTKNSFNLKRKSTNFENNRSDNSELHDSKSQNEQLIKNSDIVILYVKESDYFMNFMLDLRQSLKQYTGCDVYDWWAPNLWNDVACIGGYEWVIKKIKEDYRIVWVDTLKARMLLTSQNRIGYNKNKKSNIHYQEISDFRDSAFPAVVDFVKRSNKNLDQEYQRHFIIRTENFNTADKIEDPFADIAPHTRYLIPYHFDKLCYQLAIHDLGFEEEMEAIKIRLKKYLLEEPSMNI